MLSLSRERTSDAAAQFKIVSQHGHLTQFAGFEAGKVYSTPPSSCGRMQVIWGPCGVDGLANLRVDCRGCGGHGRRKSGAGQRSFGPSLVSRVAQYQETVYAKRHTWLHSCRSRQCQSFSLDCLIMLTSLFIP
ncbi:hypothetical protein ISS37_10185 [candidate division KSB1 bacterium]|nr:hypothetical protein [candidate division KSB1 bacterium]